MNKGVIIAIGVGIVIVAIAVGAGLTQDTSTSESPILDTSEETTETKGQEIKVHISDSAAASDKTP